MKRREATVFSAASSCAASQDLGVPCVQAELDLSGGVRSSSCSGLLLLLLSPSAVDGKLSAQSER